MRHAVRVSSAPYSNDDRSEKTTVTCLRKQKERCEGSNGVELPSLAFSLCNITSRSFCHLKVSRENHTIRFSHTVLDNQALTRLLICVGGTMLSRFARCRRGHTEEVLLSLNLRCLFLVCCQTRLSQGEEISRRTREGGWLQALQQLIYHGMLK